MYPAQSLIVPTKMAMLGIVVGAVSGLAIAQLQPGPTLAAVISRPPFQVGKALDPHIAKFDDGYYAIVHDAEVSMTPISTVTVRKIGYGTTHFVTIDTTASGTYSSDGLSSPYIRYPGIYSEKLRVDVFPVTGRVLGWSGLSGWVKIPLLSADSIAFLSTDPVPASRDGVCVVDVANGGCR